MERNLLVSIVVPIYNPSIEFLGQLFHSIDVQTYHPLEVVVSDDGNSQREIAELRARYPQLSVRYFQNASARGIFNNLNTAIEFSSGDFIQIFCQDDVMYPDFVERNVEMIRERREVGMSFCNFDVIDTGGICRPLEKRFNIRKSWPLYIGKDELAKYLLSYGCMPGNLSPVMLKRSTIRLIGLFNQQFPFAGDFEYWARLSGRLSVAYESSPKLAIRRHKDQASKAIGMRQLLLDRQRVYGKLLSVVRIDRSKSWLKVYVNQEAGSPIFYYACVLLLRYRIKEFLSILKAFRDPFSIPVSGLICLCTFNGKYKIVKLDQRRIR